MDFILGLPKTRRGFDVIWIVDDRLTKKAHFISGKSIFRLDRWAQLYVHEIVWLMAQLYVHEIVWLHGAPIPLCQFTMLDARFTSHFLEGFVESLGSLNLPPSHGQT